VSDLLVPLGRDLLSRDLFLISIRSWDDWPRDLKLPSPHFAMLLAGDAQGVPQESLDRLANAALDCGCVFLCAWGPDCGRVELAFDQSCVQRAIAVELPAAPVVMTTSHQGESIGEVVMFLMAAALPDGAFTNTCRSALVAAVGDGDWVASLRRQLGR
jgi:hypothetical protein